MCDEGRYGWKYVHDPRRLTGPQTQAGKVTSAVEWHEVPALVERDLRKSTGAKRTLAAVLSPFLSIEEAWLLGSYIRTIDASALLVLGPVPTRGEDERFPSGFTIRAEKCPNRRGVEKIMAGLGGNLIYDFTEFRQRLADSIDLGAIWFTGGYPEPWHSDQVVSEVLGKAAPQAIIVQDCLPSPLYAAATIKLPGATFAEREGSYVNAQDRLLSFAWAIRPPAGVRTEGQLYWQLLGRKGLYKAKEVLGEIAREITYFSAAAQGVPDIGVDLKVNQLA
jgi:NADH-quinone oxidoreductase subunit G